LPADVQYRRAAGARNFCQPSDAGRHERSDFFPQVSFEGWKERLQGGTRRPTPRITKRRRQVYVDRLNFELDILFQMEFPGLLPDRDGLYQRGPKNNARAGWPGRAPGPGLAGRHYFFVADSDLEFRCSYDLLFRALLNPDGSMPL